MILPTTHTPNTLHIYSHMCVFFNAYLIPFALLNLPFTRLFLRFATYNPGSRGI